MASFASGVFTALGELRPPRSAITEPALCAYIEDSGRMGDVTMCAEEDGAIVGVAWVCLMRGYGFVDERTPELVVSVLPECCRRDVGAVLLAALINQYATFGFLQSRFRLSAPILRSISTRGWVSRGLRR